MRWSSLISPEYLGCLLDSFSEGIYITNPDGLTLGVNKAYEAITGIDSSQLVGRYMHEIVAEGILSSTITEEVIKTGRVVTSDQKVFNGKRCFIKGTPIHDQNGRAILVVTVVRDIAMLDKLENEVRTQREVADSYKKQLEALSAAPPFVVRNKRFREVVSLAQRVAHLDSTVLIVGESGTGKEIIAREIHEKSPRARQPFICLNCGTIPENLLESELFGYERGAFTGASAHGHVGIFEAADKGTILLDEIGELPFSLQVKLLRMLQEKTITRVGSSKEIQVDARIIACTNENLEQMVLNRRFREDLYYRLNVVHIEIPPLRERMDEVPCLIDFFVSKINKKYKMRKYFHPNLIQEMMAHHWPGNVRELEHAVERLMVTSERDVVTGPYTSRLSSATKDCLVISGLIPLQEAQDRVEKYLFQQARKQFKTTYQIAQMLEISQPSVSRKMKKHGGSELAS